MTDFDTIVGWFREERERHSSPNTVDRYVRHVHGWQQWLDENRDKSVWEADNVDLRVFIKGLDSDGMAPTTMTQRISAISKFYQDANSLEEERQMPDVPENPYDNLQDKYKKMLQGDSKKKAALDDSDGDEFPYLEPDQVAELVENVPAPRLRNELIIKLLFNCGFRRGELAETTRDNLNREDESVFIPPMKSEEGRYVSYKYSYLGFELDQWLDYGGREAEYYAKESDYLFPTQQNEHIPGDTINKMVKQTAKNAGLQEVSAEYSDGRVQHKITPHTLRHSYAMNAINSGINVKTLQTLMGHEELDTTLIYLDQSKNEALEKSRQFEPTPNE